MSVSFQSMTALLRDGCAIWRFSAALRQGPVSARTTTSTNCQRVMDPSSFPIISIPDRKGEIHEHSVKTYPPSRLICYFPSRHVLHQGILYGELSQICNAGCFFLSYPPVTERTDTCCGPRAKDTNSTCALTSVIFSRVRFESASFF